MWLKTAWILPAFSCLTLHFSRQTPNLTCILAQKLDSGFKTDSSFVFFLAFNILMLWHHFLDILEHTGVGGELQALVSHQCFFDYT